MGNYCNTGVCKSYAKPTPQMEFHPETRPQKTKKSKKNKKGRSKKGLSRNNTFDSCKVLSQETATNNDVMATAETMYDESCPETLLPPEPTLNDANDDPEQLRLMLEARSMLLNLWVSLILMTGHTSKKKMGSRFGGVTLVTTVASS